MAIPLSDLVRNSLESCYAVLLQRDEQNYDRVVTNLESIITSLRLEENVNPLPWVRNTMSTLQIATDLIEAACNNNTEVRRRGRPRIEIPGSLVEELLYLKLSVPKIASTFGVCVSTIRRRMSENSLLVSQTFTTISQDDLETALIGILVRHPNTGYKMMKGYLWQYSQIRIPETRLRETMRVVDPVGVYQRYIQNRAVVRRVYFVSYSNELWHLDTNMKLTNYRMIIRGCIDGKSRLGLYLDVGSNNRASTSLESFMAAVTQYGVPSRVRSDKGGENVLIARFMLETRGLNRGSHITGRSVHNQRIERFWNDVYKTSGYYYETFISMQQQGILDIDDHNHLFILHYVFLPRLQRALDNFRHAWNYHPLSSERNHTPAQLFVLNRAPSSEDLLLTEEAIHETYMRCQTFHDLNYFEREEHDTTRHPGAVVHSLTDAQLDLLDTVDVFQVSENNGVDIFEHCLAIIAN